MQFIFWGIMLFVAFFGGWRGYTDAPSRPFYGFGLMLWILLALLGWKVYGPAVQG